VSGKRFYFYFLKAGGGQGENKVVKKNWVEKGQRKGKQKM
jgi:hypothetical protein